MAWRCGRCGAQHDGLPFDWAFDAPSYWDGGRSESDWLSEDFCVWTDDEGTLCYFVRGLIEIPIRDGGAFAYGVWSSLSKRSFERSLELWDRSAPIEESPYFGWLSNSIPGYASTMGLSLDVVLRSERERPAFALHEADHALVREQHEGITIARVRTIAETNLHPD